MAQGEALVQEELKKRGNSASKMSALEIAALGKHLHNAKPDDITALEMDAADADWTPFIEEAKGKGPRSWFASRVDFTLHGAHFLGKVGYSVSAGVVPLFDGAAIDLKYSSMTAKKPKDASPDDVQGSPDGYSNWIEGKGGMLVLAPVGFDNVIPVNMEKVTVTEKGISGKANKDITFHNAEQSIHASGLVLADNEVRLENPRVKTGDGPEAEVKGITIGSSGAKVGEAIVDAPIQPQQEDNTQPASADQQMDDEGDVVNQQEERPDGIVKTIDNAINTFKSDGIATGEFDESNEAQEDGGVSLRANANGDIDFQYVKKDDEEEQEESFLDKAKSAAKDRLKKEAKNLVGVMTNSEGMDERGKIGQLKKNGKDAWKQVKQIAGEAGDTGKTIRDEGRAAFNQMKEDGFVGTVKKAKDKAVELAGMGEEDVEKRVSEAANESIAVKAVQKFLGMDKGEEQDNKEEKNSEKIPLASISLLPGVRFSVTLAPELTLKPFVNVSAKNLIALFMSNPENSDFDFSFSAGMKEASLFLALSAELSEGIPYLLEANQAIKAKAGFTKADRPDAFAGKVSVPLRKKQNGEIEQRGPIVAEANADILLKSTLEFVVDVGSKLFSWNKQLYKTVLGEWDIARFNFGLKLSKAPNTGLLHGWSVDMAQLETDGLASSLAKAFSKTNNEENKYGITTPNFEETAGYQNVQQDISEALDLSEIIIGKIQNPQQNGMFIQGSGEDSDVFKQISNLALKFGVIWSKAQRENENLLEQLEIARTNTGFSKKKQSAIESSQKHQKRMDTIGSFDTDSGNIMKVYEGVGGGFGFDRHLNKRAEDEASTFEGITIYEKKRYLEKTDKYREKYMKTKAKAEEVKSLDKNKAVMELLQDYTSDSMGKKILKHLDLYQGVGKITAFENQAKLEKTEAYRNSERNFRKKEVEIDKRNKELEKKGKAPLNPNELFKSFAHDLSDEDALLFGDTTSLFAYELGQLAKYNKSMDMGHVQDLLDGKVSAGNFDTSMVEKFNKEKYRLATIDDLIAFEVSRNRGAEGEAVAAYLANHSGKGASMKDIFGDVKDGTNGRANAANIKAAKSRMAKYLASEENAKRARQYITIELLLERNKAKAAAAKTPEKRAEIAKERRFIAEAELELEYVSQKGTLEDVEKKQQELINEYFDIFSQSGDEYFKELSEGEAVNAQLMQAVFSENNSDMEENLRLTKLHQWKEEQMPDYEAVELYMKENGADKKMLSEFMEGKGKGQGNTLEQSHSFEIQILRESGKDVKKHYDRCNMIHTMDNGGKPYLEILKVYNERYEGGKGFAQAIKSKIAVGQFMDGKELTKESVLEFYSDRIKEQTKINNAHIALVEQLEKDGKSNEEIAKAYQEQVYSEWGKSSNIVSYGKALAHETLGIESRTDYAKSLEKEMVKAQKDESGAEVAKMISVENILSFAKNELERVGVPHTARLRMLYGVEELPDDLESLVAPTDENEKETRRMQYVTEAKRFKKDLKEEQEIVYESMLADTFKSTEGQKSFLKDEILKYEEERKTHYDNVLAEYEKAEEDARQRQKKLENEINLCSSFAINIMDITKNPKAASDLGEKIKKFRAMYMEAGASSESELESAEQRRTTEMVQSLVAAEQQIVSVSDEDSTGLLKNETAQANES